MKLNLSSRQLRCLVRDAVPLYQDNCSSWDEPFTESSHDDGCLGALLDCRNGDSCFTCKVPLREFLAARFGVDESAVALHWSNYEWRYSAEVEVESISSAERQRLEAYEE